MLGQRHLPRQFRQRLVLLRLPGRPPELAAGVEQLLHPPGGDDDLSCRRQRRGLLGSGRQKLAEVLHVACVAELRLEVDKRVHPNHSPVLSKQRAAAVAG